MQELSVLDSLCAPSLIRFKPGFSALSFDLMKIVPARFIVEDALRSGTLAPGGLVVESSSGTFALGLATVCANLGLRLSLVTGQLEELLEWRLRDLGACIEKVFSGKGHMGGIQQKRLDRLAQIRADNLGAFWPRQYDNPLHPTAYEAIAKSVGHALGPIDYLVASVGTGGSISGFARVLRKFHPGLAVIGVDHNLSVLFGPTSGEATLICRECYEPLLGMGSDVVIANLDHAQCDEVHWVPVAQMIRAAHEIHARHGILSGPTSGAAYSVAAWIARSNPSARILTIFPDHGIRYVRTVYDQTWLREREFELQRMWAGPSQVESPTAVGMDWAYFRWGRRTYEEVLGHPPVSRGASAPGQPA